MHQNFESPLLPTGIFCSFSEKYDIVYKTQKFPGNEPGTRSTLINPWKTALRFRFSLQWAHGALSCRGIDRAFEL